MGVLHNSTIVKYNRNGVSLEVLVDFSSYEKFLEDDSILIDDVLLDENIYSDVKKVKRASDEEISKALEEDLDFDLRIRKILKFGEPKIPNEVLKKRREETKEKVLNYILENTINPQGNLKFSKVVMEGELSKISYSYEPNRDYVFQAEEIIKKLSSKFPIKIDKKTMIITIPAKYSYVIHKIRPIGNITKQEYDNHSNLKVHLDVSSSKEDYAIRELKRLTNDEVEYHIKN